MQIENFIEFQSIMISDPLQFLKLIDVVLEFSKGVLGQRLNIDQIGDNLAKIIGGSGDVSQAVVGEAEAMGIDISSIETIDVDENHEDKLFQQQNGNQKKKELDENKNYEQELAREHSKQLDSERTFGSFRVKSKFNVDLVDGVSKILQGMDKFVGNNKATYFNQLQKMMGAFNIYLEKLHKSNLDKAMNDALEQLDGVT